MKKAAFIVCLVVMALCFGGCGLIRIEEGQLEPVEYTVLNSQDVPGEVRALIEEKKEREFQMTYQSGENLYLVKGYGRQMSGGYSIQVEEMGVSKNALFFRTKLLGPEDDEAVDEPSYPCIVVRIQFREEPVMFE